MANKASQKKEQCNIYIPSEVQAKVAIIAEYEGVSKSHVYRMFIKDMIRKWEKRNGEIK